MPTSKRRPHWLLIFAPFLCTLCILSTSAFGLSGQSPAPSPSPQPSIQGENASGATTGKKCSSDLLEFSKIGGAAIAFCVGLWQYSRAQRWKRVEFVASEMKSFFDDESAKAAMLMLDWSQKEIELQRHRDGSNHTKTWVTYAIAATALNTDPDATYDEVQSPIREIFDGFLASLERFESFIESGVVNEEDLSPYLHYWTKLLSGNDEKSPIVTKELLPQLWTFAAHYRYTKVVKFVNRYDKLAPELRVKAEE